MSEKKRSRSISYSEIQTAMTCWARWDFAYGGRLAGSSLKAKEVARVLSDGRAWGRAVASYHSQGDRLFPLIDARAALTQALTEDAQAQEELGIPVDAAALIEMEMRLAGILEHYALTSDPLPGVLTRLEDAVDVALPSRSGVRSSTRYRFEGFIDGFIEDGGQWIVEYKLRGQLTPAWLIELNQQVKWYAWARRKETGQDVVGVLVDERLNEAPKAAQITPKTRRAAHKKEQLTTPELYMAACYETDEDPHDDVIEALRAREWQHRIPILFRPGELDAAGEELIAASKLIRDLDAGDLSPVRNSGAQLCKGCRYRRICKEPDDDLYVETMFERVAPKRFRDTVAA